MNLLRARRSDLDDAGVRVFGISRDSPWSHVAWSQVLDLGFPLLSDWSGDATRALGIGMEFRGLADVPGRCAFLVDGAGIIRRTWAYGIADLPDVDELIEAARALTTPTA